MRPMLPGTLIESRMKAKGWGRWELAMVIQKSEAYVGRVIRGAKRVRVEDAVLFGAALDIPVMELMGMANKLGLWEYDRSPKAKRQRPPEYFI